MKIEETGLLYKNGVRDLPSAELERKKGRLILGFFTCQCSECGALFHELEYTNFCSNCGTKWENGANDE